MMVTREMEKKGKVTQKQIEIESRERASPIISENIMSSPEGEPVIEEDVQSVQMTKIEERNLRM